MACLDLEMTIAYQGLAPFLSKVDGVHKFTVNVLKKRHQRIKESRES
jgi:hypothetical protein